MPTQHTTFRDASELRLAPGYWPNELRFDGGEPFRKQLIERTPDGDVGSVTYVGPNGMELVIFND